ncbi:MAG: hypothetical protein ACTSQY_06910 [Candidatus Odinarchaeia archaeon]
MPYQLDTSKKGLDMFFKPWQTEAIHYLNRIHPEGANSREVCEAVNKNLTISRASVINFLNAGGYHRVYHLNYKDNELHKHLAEHMIKKLLEDFPEATSQIIKTMK